MRKIKRLAALFSAAAVALTSPVSAVHATGSIGRTIGQMLSEMTTEQKIEQMMMISFRQWSLNGGGSYDVTSLNDELKDFIGRHDFGGVCLFAQNIRGTAQCVGLTAEIQQAALNSECGIPMLISTDQEGGMIYRLGTGTPTCGNMAIGAANDPALAEKNARILGSEIAALGINTDLAPVMDVNNNPANPIINIRSFSSDPAIVSEMGLQYIKGLQSEGIVTACKHFPGHGDTAADSHTGLPLISKSLDDLKKLELVPYNEDVIGSTDMIMTAHIQFPQIESGTYTSISSGQQVNLPATLSRTMITDVLRGELGYTGVVLTDSMQMDAIRQNFDPIDAAVLAMNADVDIILEPVIIQSAADIAVMERYISDIVRQVDDGNIPIETIDRSVMRILAMKQERGILSYTAPDVEYALKTVGSSDNREIALQIAERAVTLVKNDGDLLPLDLGASGRAAFFYPYANAENTMIFALDRLKKDGVIAEGVTADRICHRYHAAAEFEENVKNSDVVILAFEMYSVENLDETDYSIGWQARFADDMISLAHANGRKVVLISANIPYDIARFPDADAILAAYCANPMDVLPVDGEENPAYGVNYPAALITVFGGNHPSGKLPADVYALGENAQFTDGIAYPLGCGLTYVSDEPETVTTVAATTVTVTTTSGAVAATVSSAAVTSSVPHTRETGKKVPWIAVAALALSGIAAAACVIRKKRA